MAEPSMPDDGTQPQEAAVPVAAATSAPVPHEHAHKKVGRAWVRTVLVAALGLVLLVAVLLVAAVWWVTRHETGGAAALSRVPGLVVEGQQGPLTGGAFRAKRLVYRIGGTVIEIDDLRWKHASWTLRPRPGQWLGLAVDAPEAARVQVRTTASDAPPAVPQSLRLPMALTLKALRVDALAVDALPLVSDVRGTLHIGADAGTTHRIEDLGFTWQRVRAEAKGSIGADAPLSVALDIAARNAEASATIPWQARAQWQGPLAKLDVVASLRAEPPPASPAPAAGTAPAAMALDARTTVEPFAAWPLATLDATLRDLDLAAFADAAPRTRLGGSVTLAMPSRQAPLQLRAALDNAAPGRWDQGALPIRELVVDASAGAAGKLSETERIELSKIALQLHDDAGRIDGKGLWNGEALKLELETRTLRPSKLDHRAAAMTLSGPITVDVQGVPNPRRWLGDAASQVATASAVQDARVQARLQGRLDGEVALAATTLQGKAGAARASPGTPRPGASGIAAAAGARAQGPLAAVVLDARGHRSADALKLQLDTFTVESAGAKAQLQGRVERRGKGPWAVTAEGALQDFDPLPWFPGEPASAWREGPHRFNGRIVGAGTVPASIGGAEPAQPSRKLLDLALESRGSLDLELQDSKLAGVPLQAKAGWRNEDGSARLLASITSGANTAELDARLDAAGQDRSSWRVQAPQLAALAPILRLLPSTAAALPLSGAVQAEVDTEGRWPRLEARGTARLKDARAGAWRVGAARSTWRIGVDARAPLQWTVELDDLAEATRGQAAGGETVERRIERARLSVDGNLDLHRIEVEASSPIRPPAWGAALAGDDQASARGTRFALRGEGRWSPRSDAPVAATLAEQVRQGGQWRLQIDRLQVQPRQGALSWLDASKLQAELGFAAGPRLVRAQLEPGRVGLVEGELRWTQARWSSEPGTGTPPALDLDAQLEPLRIAPLIARLAPGLGLGGDLQIGGSVKVRSTADRFTVDAVIERRTGDLSLVEEGGLTQNLGLTDLRLSLTAQDGTWHVTQAAAGTNLGVLAGAQSLRVPTAARWPASDTPLEGVISWRVDNLAALAPWLPPGWRAGGTLTAGASFGGRFGAPEISGSLSGTQLSLRSALEGVDVRDGELQVTLRRQEATIDRFVFKGGSGELRLSGGGSFGPSGTARIEVDARQFQMLGRVDRRIVATGRASAVIKPDEFQVDGAFTVDEGLIDLSRRDAPKLDDDVAVLRENGSRNAELFPEEVPDDAAASAPRRGPLATTRLNVQLDLGPALHLKGRGIDTRLAGALAITSPNNRIALNGSVRTESGTYTAYGQNLVIRRGVIRFTGPVESPQLDIMAGRENLDVEVGVAITGSAQTPRVRLTSEPEMSDIDKLSWLILGRGPDGLGRTDTALLQRAALAIWAGEEGSSPTDTLLKTLGLDEFSVSQADSGEVRDTVIRVGKQISRRWYVGYERGVNTSTGTWQVIYRLAQRLTVRAQSGSDNSLDMIWSWRWK